MKLFSPRRAVICARTGFVEEEEQCLSKPCIIYSPDPNTQSPTPQRVTKPSFGNDGGVLIEIKRTPVRMHNNFISTPRYKRIHASHEVLRKYLYIYIHPSRAPDIFLLLGKQQAHAWPLATLRKLRKPNKHKIWLAAFFFHELLSTVLWLTTLDNTAQHYELV